MIADSDVQSQFFSQGLLNKSIRTDFGDHRIGKNNAFATHCLQVFGHTTVIQIIDTGSNGISLEQMKSFEPVYSIIMVGRMEAVG